MAGSIATALWFSGDKPKIPAYPLVDIEGEQKASINQNLQALPKLQTLATRINDFQSDEIMRLLEKNLPGFSNMLREGTETIQSQLRGEIPEDVARNVSRNALERSRAGGYAGSEFSGNLEARDLGLTSLDITNRALGYAERWMAQAAARTPTFDFTRMFISPQERINIKLRENEQVFSRNMLHNRIKALPSNEERAAGAFFDNVEELGQSALGAYAGGAMGGGGSGMMGGGGGGGATSNVSPSWADSAFQSYSAPSSPAPAVSTPSGSGFQYQNNYNGAPAWWP